MRLLIFFPKRMNEVSMGGYIWHKKMKIFKKILIVENFNHKYRHTGSEKSTINSHVPIAQLQQLATHGLSAPPTSFHATALF